MKGKNYNPMQLCEEHVYMFGEDFFTAALSLKVYELSLKSIPMENIKRDGVCSAEYRL